MLISNIDIDVDIIYDTFDVSISISTILSYRSIDRGINDTLLAFVSTLHRYFSTDMQDDAHNFLSFRELLYAFSVLLKYYTNVELRVIKYNHESIMIVPRRRQGTRLVPILLAQPYLLCFVCFSHI